MTTEERKIPDELFEVLFLMTTRPGGSPVAEAAEALIGSTDATAPKWQAYVRGCCEKAFNDAPPEIQADGWDGVMQILVEGTQQLLLADRIAQILERMAAVANQENKRNAADDHTSDGVEIPSTH